MSTFDPQLGYRGELHTDWLLYLRARDYQPATGAFTTTDPFDGTEGTTTVANPYSYANNDPLNHTDPTGMFAIGDGAFDEGDLILATSFEDCAPCIPPIDRDGNILVYNAHTSHCGYWYKDCGTAPLGGFGRYVCDHLTGIIQIAGVVGATAVVVAAGIVAAPYIAAGARAFFAGMSAWCANQPTCQRLLDYLQRNAPEDAGSVPSAANQAAYRYATEATNLEHTFAAKHNFEPLLQQFGSRQAVVQQMLNGLRSTLPVRM